MREFLLSCLVLEAGRELSPTGVVAAQSSAAQLVKLFLGYVTSQAVAEYFVRFECGQVCDCSCFNLVMV